MGNPNFAAILVVMAIPVGLGCLIGRDWLMAAYLATLGWHLVVLGSRGAIISLGAVLCVWGIVLKGFERLTFLVLGMLVITILLLHQPRLSFPTFENRLPWWKGSLLMAEDYPVFGVGRGNWSLVYPMYAMLTGDRVMDTHEIKVNGIASKAFVNQAHNDYLQILAEIGPIGLTALLWFIYQIIPPSRRFNDDQGTRGTMLGIFLGWCSLLIGGLFSFPLQMPELSVWFWMFSGILALDRLAPVTQVLPQAALPLPDPPASAVGRPSA
jgi:O-antigen ligase